MLCMLRDGHGLRAQQAPAPAPASTAAAAPDPAPRTIRLEAITTDKLGAPIANLRAEDFSVLVDGVAQKLDGVEARSNAPPAVGPVAPPDEIKDDADEARAAREPGTRVVGIYLDEYHVSAGENTERVRNAVSRFLDDELRPSDLVVVMRPLDHLTDIRFTRDRTAARCRRQQLHRAAQRLHAALGVRGSASRPIAKCGARGACADCDVWTPRPGDQDGRPQRRPRRDRAAQ